MANLRPIIIYILYDYTMVRSAEAKILGQSLANIKTYYTMMIDHWLARPLQSIYEMANLQTIIFASFQSKSYRLTILSKKWLATAGQSFLTHESPIYKVRSSWSKNDWL